MSIFCFDYGTLELKFQQGADNFHIFSESWFHISYTQELTASKIQEYLGN